MGPRAAPWYVVLRCWAPSEAITQPATAERAQLQVIARINPGIVFQ